MAALVLRTIEHKPWTDEDRAEFRRITGNYKDLAVSAFDHPDSLLNGMRY